MMHQLKHLFRKRSKDEQKLFQKIKEEVFGNQENFFAGNLLHRAYQTYPNNIALECQDKKITYKELYFRALELSETYIKHGVKPGNHVMVYLENSIEFYIAYYAAWVCGCVIIPLNIFLHEKELAYIINDALPKIIFSTDVFEKKLQTLIEQNLLSQLPTILTQDTINWQTPVPKTIKEIEATELPYDNMCLLLYTSGTSGKPKGVMLSSRNIVTNAMQSGTRFKKFGLLDEERFFCVLPLFHVFAQNACIWLPALTGGTVIIVSRIDRKMILEGLKKKPSLFLGFPALYGLLCLMKTAPLDSIKFFVSGADMLPDKIRSAFAMIYGRKICSGYGLTEASPVISINIENNEEPTNVVGNPLPEITCEIRDDQGEKLSTGHIGTLWVKGDNVMVGYYKDPEMTAQTIQDGWLCTGDLASIDEKGILAITGRSKDLIIHKGFNIYPQEIENILMSHPAVFRAAVVGKHEDATGQIPIAFVAAKEIDESLEKKLRELCANNLATYKIPRKFICLEDLPINATGKIDKKQLKQFKNI